MDLVTLYFTSTVSAISAAVAMLFVWRVHRNDRAVWFWMLGFVAYAFGTLPFALNMVMPPPVSRIFGNSCAALALALLYIGTANFLERPVRWRLLAIVYVPALLLNVYGAMIDESMAARVTAYTLCVVTACGLMAHGLIVHIAPAQRGVGRFVACVWLLYAIVCLVRLIGVWDVSPDATMVKVGYPQMLFFGVLQIVTLLSSVGHLLLASQRLQLRLDALANRDELTGLYNRRAFRSLAEQRRVSPDPHGSLVLMMLDIDHFKRINDEFGHFGGDEVLRSIAQLVDANLRSGDIFARAGGEEFWLLSSAIAPGAAAAAAERLRLANSVEKLCSKFGGQKITRVGSLEQEKRAVERH
ncbi:MAG TPA: GGDEF domain-containing protein [Fontimonas sp.]